MPEIILEAVLLTCGRPQRCRDSVAAAATALAGLQGSVLVVNNGRDRLDLPASIADVPCRVLESGCNLGSTARNLALAADNPPRYLFMLDDDAVLTREAILAALRVFEADEETGLVAFRVRNTGGEEGCLLPTIFHGCACAFRSAALREAGGYPDGYIYYGEEYDVAFRLARCGWRARLVCDPAVAFHWRSGEGRNIRRILYLLIRNNAFLWMSAFPRRAVASAVADTVYRYWRVARKEKALRGFLEGCLAVPLSLLRGIGRRYTLPDDIFRKMTLVEPLDGLCRQLRGQGVRRVVVCGVGKFPGLWRRIIGHHGIAVASYLDDNPCWQGGRVHGVPVFVSDCLADDGHTHAVFINGLASLAETAEWHRKLMDAGRTPVARDDEASAFFSGSGTIDLWEHPPLQAYGAISASDSQV